MPRRPVECSRSSAPAIWAVWRRLQGAGEQLVFPFQLHVGDVILKAGDHFQIVCRPAGASSGKMTRALVRREGETTPYEAMWEVWRKVRLVRSTAA